MAGETTPDRETVELLGRVVSIAHGRLTGAPRGLHALVEPIRDELDAINDPDQVCPDCGATLDTCDDADHRLRALLRLLENGQAQ